MIFSIVIKLIVNRYLIMAMSVIILFITLIHKNSIREIIIIVI